jgi:hypothetical protein
VFVPPFHFGDDGNNNPGLQFLAQEKPHRRAFTMSFFFAWCGQSVLYPGSSKEDFSFGSYYFMFNRVLADDSPLVSFSPLFVGLTSAC